MPIQYAPVSGTVKVSHDSLLSLKSSLKKTLKINLNLAFKGSMFYMIKIQGFNL